MMLEGALVTLYTPNGELIMVQQTGEPGQQRWALSTILAHTHEDAPLGGQSSQVTLYHSAITRRIVGCLQPWRRAHSTDLFFEEKCAARHGVGCDMGHRMQMAHGTHVRHCCAGELRLPFFSPASLFSVVRKGTLVAFRSVGCASSTSCRFCNEHTCASSCTTCCG